MTNEEMKVKIAGLGGIIGTIEEVPPHIEEEFLRQVLKRPERGFLYRQEHGIPETETGK